MGDAEVRWPKGLYFTSPTWPVSGGAGSGTICFGAIKIGSYSLVEMASSTKMDRAWTAQAWLHLKGDPPTDLGAVLYDGGDIDRALRVVVLEAIAVHFLEPVERGVGALVRGGQQPEEIVRVLATDKPPVDSEYGTCVFCDVGRSGPPTDRTDARMDPANHDVGCPWRMGREWGQPAD